jgi:hypothetical protein
VISVSGAWP